MSKQAIDNLMNWVIWGDKAKEWAMQNMQGIQESEEEEQRRPQFIEDQLIEHSLS